jgi:tetratricopeptide (TPR) repeat protein
LSVPAARIPAGLDAQAGLYRSLLAGQRMLVLLDNARDVDQVRPLLPASPGCLVIVTSRNQLTSLVAAEGASPLTLDVLTDGEAHELLTRRLGAQRVADDPGAADELIQQCARLPLALSIAAAHSASQPGLSLAALTADLGDARGRLDALDAGHAATNVRAVLSWSYQQLDAATARLFRLLGLHTGPDVSVAAAASMAGLARPETRRRLSELAQAHLLTEHAPGRFSCHDLLRAYAAELAQSADSQAERHVATGRMLDHYLHTAYSATMLLAPTRRPVTLAPLQPGVTPEHIAGTEQALAWYEVECQVLMAAVARARDTGFDTHAWQIPWALSRFLDQALQALDAFAGTDDQPGRALALNSAGWMYTHFGDHRQALRYCEQAVDLLRDLGNREGEASTLDSLGYTHQQLGNHAESVACYQRAIDLYGEIGHRWGAAETLGRLGDAHQAAGDLGEARTAWEDALAILDELHHPEAARIRAKLSGL